MSDEKKPEKINRRKTHSGLFKKGDPRINRAGSLPVPARIDEIKNEIKHLFMEFFRKYYHSNYEECVAQLQSKQLTVGETLAARFLIQACGPNGTVQHATFIARLVGIKLDPDTQVNIQNNVHLSLEDMVSAAQLPENGNTVSKLTTINPPKIEYVEGEIVDGKAKAKTKTKAT